MDASKAPRKKEKSFEIPLKGINELGSLVALLLTRPALDIAGSDFERRQQPRELDRCNRLTPLAPFRPGAVLHVMQCSHDVRAEHRAIAFGCAEHQALAVREEITQIGEQL